MLLDTLVAHDPATHAVADHDYVASDGLAKNQVVKRRHAIEFSWRHSEVQGDITQALIGDPTTVPLDDLERIYANCLALWIMRCFGLDLADFFRRQHH